MTDDRVEFHLWNWTRWQEQSVGDVDLSYPGRSQGLTNYSSTPHDDKAYDKICFWWAQTVNTIVENDLPPDQRAAVHNKHLYCLFVIHDELSAYQAAFEGIRIGLVRRSVV